MNNAMLFCNLDLNELTAIGNFNDSLPEECKGGLLDGLLCSANQREIFIGFW